MVGGGPSHVCSVLQSSGIGSALVQSGDVGRFNGNIEAFSGGTYGVFTEGER